MESGKDLKTLVVRGPALSRSGYGEMVRFALGALREREDEFDLYLLNTKWGESGWLHDDNEERAWMDELAKKFVMRYQGDKSKFDISIQVILPNEWNPSLAKRNVGYTAGVETDAVPAQWISYVAAMDEIIVPSNHTKNSFEITIDAITRQRPGLDFPEIQVVPLFVSDCSGKIDLDLEMDFNFLNVSQWGPRKNIDALITAFLEEFLNEKVGLVLKLGVKNGSLYDRNYCVGRLRYILEHFPKERECQVNLIHGNLSDTEMDALFSHPKIKAYTSMTHGEGFGLPVFQAALKGLPIIAPFWGGITDFTAINGKSMIENVDYKIDTVQPEAVMPNVILPDAKWCHPNIDSMRKQMRQFFSNYSEERAQKLQKHVVGRFTEDKIRGKFINMVKGEANG